MNRIAVAMMSLSLIAIAQAAPQNEPASGQPGCSPLNIAIDGPKGGSFRLLYTSGSGWAFADQHGPKLASARIALGSTGPIEPLRTEKPQSVFVDGPSGYVFIYVNDEGWRFVGTLSGTKQ